MFGLCFKTYLKKKTSNIVIIKPVKINDVIYRMEGLYKIPTADRKPHGSSSDMKSKEVNMDTFRSEYLKNSRIPKELSLYQSSKSKEALE